MTGRQVSGSQRFGVGATDGRGRLLLPAGKRAQGKFNLTRVPLDFALQTYCTNPRLQHRTADSADLLSHQVKCLPVLWWILSTLTADIP